MAEKHLKKMSTSLALQGNASKKVVRLRSTKRVRPMPEGEWTKKITLRLLEVQTHAVPVEISVAVLQEDGRESISISCYTTLSHIL